MAIQTLTAQGQVLLDLYRRRTACERLFRTCKLLAGKPR
jgi:hypothetical protein